MAPASEVGGTSDARKQAGDLAIGLPVLFWD